MVLWLIPFLTLRGTFRSLSAAAALFCIPTGNIQTRVAVSPQPCRHLLFSGLLSGSESGPHCGAGGTLMTIEHLLTYLEDQVRVFGETSIQVPLPIFHWAVCLFVWGLSEIFIHSGY